MALTKVIGSGIGTVTNQFANTNMVAGSVVQTVLVKQDVGTSSINTTNANFVSTALFAQITPVATSSKILVSFSFVGYNTGANAYVQATVFRGITSSTNANTQIAGGTNLSGAGDDLTSYGMTTHYEQQLGGGTMASTALDSPSSTSQQTYTLAYSAHGNGGTAVFNLNDAYAYLMLQEIRG